MNTKKILICSLLLCNISIVAMEEKKISNSSIPNKVIQEKLEANPYRRDRDHIDNNNNSPYLTKGNLLYHRTFGFGEEWRTQRSWGRKNTRHLY